ncbi:MAG: mechanosensitive ion channel family protein, partial [Cyclobacteriaceae bacterium]|nr:mechanosensitive ion channel family protein [Cyclobacteriaceae bacterium]
FKILYTVLIILMIGLLRYVLLKMINRSVGDIKLKYYWQNMVRYIAFILGFIVISGIWVEEFRSVATFFGLLSAGVAIALKDPILNIAGWVFILFRKPFTVGDRIQVGNNAGDVIDIRLFQFTLNEIGNWVDADQSTGRVIHIPNGRVFLEAQANYTQGFSHLWNEIGVMITFESNWVKAKEILMEIVQHNSANLTGAAQKKLIEASKKFMIYYNTLSPNVYTRVKEYGVQLTMRYLCEPKKRRMTEHQIWESVLTEFAKHKDISFAYPTQRFFFNRKEGKGREETKER